MAYMKTKERRVRGDLLILRPAVARAGQRGAYDVYTELDLGPRGYAVAPASQRHRS